MRGFRDVLARMFLGSRSLDWPGLQEDSSRSGRPGGRQGREEHHPPEQPGRDDAGERGGERGDLPPLRPDWRDIVAFTIAMYQILAVPFLLFCGVALFIYLLLWLWAR